MDGSPENSPPSAIPVRCTKPFMKIFPISKGHIQGPDFISLDVENLREQLAFAKANKIEGFTLMHEWTKQPFPNLDFLLEINVRGLIINFEAVKDISAINNLSGLEMLKFGHASYPQSDIDLSQFKSLTVLDANWNKFIKNLEALTNVIRLSLWGYKPKSRNLESLKNCNNLVDLNLVQPGIDNLNGIESLNRLKEFDLGNARSLKTFLSGKKDFTSPLESLKFSLCPNLDIETILTIPTLKFFGLSRIGKRQSLKGNLLKFPNLETIAFTQSELIDGNLDYFLEHPTLKKVIIDNKKHYNLKEKEIQKKLNERYSAETQ